MKKDFTDFFTQKHTRWLVGILAAGAVLLLTFHAGLSVGERHAYARMGHMRAGMMPPPGAMGGLLPHGFLPEDHGAVGTITTIALPLVTIETRSGEKEIIHVGTTTLIQGMSATSTSSLTVGQNVVIIGEPHEPISNEQGEQEQIEARFIKILP